MNNSAIKKLRKKFVLVAMGSLVVSMVLIVAFLYFGTKAINRQAIYNSIDYIIENNGDLDSVDFDDAVSTEEYGVVRALEDIFNVSQNRLSPEFRYAARYFAIHFDSENYITQIKTGHISAVSTEEASEYGELALSSGKTFGQYGDYFYKVAYEEDGSGIIVYLDGSDTIRSNSRLLYLALIVIAFGTLISFFVARKFSSWALEGEVKNVEIQNQFMTNISHELKTPLAVIKANTEMQEMLTGENDWSLSTRRQIDRMDGLINSLVTISRAEERSIENESETVSFSEIVADTAKSFSSVAISSGKNMSQDVDENLTVHGDEAQIRQLCSLLVDNAIKYCDDGGDIKVSLKSKGRNVLLSVSNSYADGKNVDYSRFFERFYRQDTSHNIDKGGYGIGLSVAESIVNSYHGKITASWSDGMIYFDCLLKA